ncbi:MAG TPA: phosphodiester glycosidase family protein [Verrucomicrobiae bacterium]
MRTSAIFVWALGLLLGAPAPQSAGAEPKPVLQSIRRENYPCTIHVIKVPRTRQFEFRSLHADGKALGLESLSGQMKHANGEKFLAAINGDFYVRQGPYEGDPRGLQMVRGEMISAPSGGASFWIDASDQPHTGITTSKLRVELPDGSNTPIELNAPGEDNTVVLYTPTAATEIRSRGSELILERDGASQWLPLKPGRILTARVREVKKGGRVQIAPDVMVLSFGRRAKVPALAKGATLKINTETEPGLRGVSEAISAGPVLVREGKRVPVKAPKSDSYVFSSMTESHPRSAIGWNDEFYFLVSVDGRKPDSVGLSLDELSRELIKLGCTDAMNLDGGGSATLWFEGKIRNYLCDGYERKIANGLGVVELTEKK